MKSISIVVIVLTLAALPAPAVGQNSDLTSVDAKCRQAETNLPLAKFDGESPIVRGAFNLTMISISPYGNCRFISFYRLGADMPQGISAKERRDKYFGVTAPPRFFVRYVDDNPAFDFNPRWADQENCPVIIPALEKLEPILRPKFTGDSPYRNAMSSVSDAPRYEVWTQDTVYPIANSAYRLETRIESVGETTALSLWFDEAIKAIEPCLDIAEPKAR